MEEFSSRIIATIHSDFSSKFGIPRQSGLVPELISEVHFEKEFQDRNAFRGLEGYSHIWLIWVFSRSIGKKWAPTVKPPRLGGNERVGVFATRSPFRPNPIGLSCVKLEEIVYSGSDGPVLRVSGADLMDGTPILDIKPYVPYADCVADAASGFVAAVPRQKLQVSDLNGALEHLPEEKRTALIGILSEDPRPSYQDDPDREYGLGFAGRNVKFKVCGNQLSITEIT